MDSNGSLSNYTGDNSLVFPLNRIISNSYSFDVQRTNISHLGNLGTIFRPILNNTEVNFSFDYYLNGLLNDVRLGLYCNIPSGNTSLGPLIFGNTNRTSILSGFYTRDNARSNENSLQWPPKCREPKNLFVASKKDYLDYNDISQGLYRERDIDVYAFGDCFLSSYKCQASISQIPTVSVNYICNNLEVYGSGVNCDSPSLDTRNYNINSGTKFSIPNNFQGTGLPTVLIPQDIIINIQQQDPNYSLTNGYLLDEFGNRLITEDNNYLTITSLQQSDYDINNLPVDFNDIKIQSFDFGFELNRNNMYGIGYKFPLDKQIVWPVISNLNFSFLPGDLKTSSLVSLIKDDKKYNISIKLKYQNNTRNWTGVAIQYDFVGSKINNFNSNISISNRLENSLSFTTEINPLKTGEGLFISGFLSIPYSPMSSGYLLDESGNKLIMENGDYFLISSNGDIVRVLY